MRSKVTMEKRSRVVGPGLAGVKMRCQRSSWIRGQRLNQGIPEVKGQRGVKGHHGVEVKG